MASVAATIRHMELDLGGVNGEASAAAAQAAAMRAQVEGRAREAAALQGKLQGLQALTDNGTRQLQRLDGEARALALQRTELARSLALAAGGPGRCEQLDEQVAALKAQLLAARQQVEDTGAALESPRANARWRMLGGKIPSHEAVAGSAAELEARLAAKKWEASERQLLLEEVARLVSDLEAAACEGHGPALALRQELLDAQKQVSRVAHSVMATVSELSMMQAHALQLAADRDHLAGILADAQQRVAAGLPPTDKADAEFRAVLERQAAQAEALRQLKARVEGGQEERFCAAEPRPRVYLPPAGVLPKPFGALAPFKPSAQGAAMRHFRPPAAQPVRLAPMPAAV